MRGIHLKLLALIAITVCASVNAQVLFEDDFNGGMSNVWAITNPDTNYYYFNSSELVLTVPPNDIYVGGAEPKNLFLINNPTTGDFTATLKIDSFSLNTVNYAQIDVIALDDVNDLVRSIYGFITQTQAQLGKEVLGSWIPQQTPLSLGSGGFYLRLTKIGTNYSQSYSLDGANYTQINTNITFGNGMPKHLGFCAGDDPTSSSQFYIDSFTVSGVPPPTVPVSIAPAVQISWAATNGKPYQLQSTVSLSNPNWTNVGPVITASNNLGTNVFELATNGTAQYYRVTTSP